MTGQKPVRRQKRTLGFARFGQPVAEPLSEPFAVPFGLVRGQHRGAGPGGDNETLGGHQRREAAAALGNYVAQREPEPFALPERFGARLRDQTRRFVRGALEHCVQRMAGTGEDAVEAACAKLDEAVEFPGAHHRTRPVEAEQRDQRAVAAGQHAGPAGERERRRRHQETLHRLFADCPAQPQRILDRAVH